MPRQVNPKRKQVSKTRNCKESQKKRVIRSLFALRLRVKREPLPWIVSLEEVQSAIERANARWRKSGVGTLSTRNPANFLKDIVRREQAYRATWPWSALARGYIGIQVKGAKAEIGAPKRKSPCFEFIHVDSANPIGELYQQVPLYQRPDPTGEVPVFNIQTLELPPEVRRLKRKDESFLLQLIVRLRVIETHLSMVSRKGLESLTHLQMGLKLRGAEIDGLFLGELRPKNKKMRLSTKRRILVALEAKGESDDILKGQIKDQVVALFRLDVFKDEVDFVAPMAVKLVRPNCIYVAEFRLVARPGIASRRPALGTLRLASEAFYEFVPPIGNLDRSRKAQRRPTVVSASTRHE